ncbi:MAG TPA: DinB family protein [Candidatus Methylacidiphilales bacterium]|nr:DinB family protein [Candidatus Methylacidiphilales bacterium]
MSLSPPSSVPRLAAPGAGLPPIELRVARVLFAWARWRGSREIFTRQFEREREAILSLARSSPPKIAAQRVLIERLPGMEDSSRYWSVWMTLDHLRIVNLGMAATIRSLGNGVVPEREARTADVKPDTAADAASVENFERSCDMFLKTAAKIPGLKTPLRHAHPWFGLLNAQGWYALGGSHLKLHRRQIERILAGAQKQILS